MANAVYKIPPVGEILTFENREEYIEKGLEWSLFTARSVKDELWYKTSHYQGKVKLVGFQVYSNGFNTIVVEFEDGSLSCIHPAYLKEMQSNSFGKELLSGTVYETAIEITKDTIEALVEEIVPEKASKPKEKKSKKEKKPKLALPEDKVHFTAKIKEFTMKMNHFTGEEDEVILLEDVQIIGESELFIGDAWCAYSKTLKKLELEEHDQIEFDGKIVDKKFNKEILYKINNPSKLKKEVD
ncbi:hypothetical protein [Peribacillus loiseleuriae]|uniref:hypothetical protein n=1 Tax=Peribacillus loiseleuriae TaxID=1679170 RepID=UPI003CFD8AA3